MTPQKAQRRVDICRQLIGNPTGAQEWHIVSLLGDVTSPTIAAHYVSMTSDLCVLSTEKHCPVRRTAHGVHNQEFTMQEGST